MACLMELAFSFTSSLIKLSTSANAWPLEQSHGLEMGRWPFVRWQLRFGKVYVCHEVAHSNMYCFYVYTTNRSPESNQ